MVGRFTEIADPDLYKRAVQYMYLSETKGSFGIEREIANAGKEGRFVRLLQRAGENAVSEEWLVELQNAVVRDDFSKEASFRFKQNRFDLPDSDANALVRKIHGKRGTLSAGMRRRFARLPAKVVEKIEAIVQESFGRP